MKTNYENWIKCPMGKRPCMKGVAGATPVLWAIFGPPDRCVRLLLKPQKQAAIIHERWKS